MDEIANKLDRLSVMDTATADELTVKEVCGKVGSHWRGVKVEHQDERLFEICTEMMLNHEIFFQDAVLLADRPSRRQQLMQMCPAISKDKLCTDQVLEWFFEEKQELYEEAAVLRQKLEIGNKATEVQEEEGNTNKSTDTNTKREL
jgi:hypothetical protein